MANLNNSAAYGFAANVIRPVVIKAIKAGDDTVTSIKEGKAIADKIKPVAITVMNGRKKTEISIVNYFENGVIALSMFNMMNAKNIAFITSGRVYVVSGDKLRSNWQAILTRVKNYTDGSNVRSEMTYADIDKVTGLADVSYSISDEDAEKFSNELEQYKKSMK